MCASESRVEPAIAVGTSDISFSSIKNHRSPCLTGGPLRALDQRKLSLNAVFTQGEVRLGCVASIVPQAFHLCNEVARAGQDELEKLPEKSI